MTRSRSRSDSGPACYAVVIPGLEKIAAEEITSDLGGEVKRTSAGIVVFRPPVIDSSLLELRTTEDVFLLAWGTDQLSYRARDLESIQRWTARQVDWGQLLRLHHSIRPKPKGKPTWRLVTQMTGRHGYRRVDARKALARGLEGKIPASWRHVEENAALEIWLTIHGATAVCGVRLSDRTMRHRTWKLEHVPASLRPTVAAAMVRLAEAQPGMVMLDPMCGAGTILAEQLALTRAGEKPAVLALGGDRELEALRNSRANLRDFRGWELCQWDAIWLPLGDGSVDCIISNPPFGKQLAQDEDIAALYQRLISELDRVLRRGGKAVLLTSAFAALQAACGAAGWKNERKVGLRLLGQGAVISVWRKPRKPS